MRAADTESTCVVEKIKKRKVPKPAFWSPECKYNVIMNVAKSFGWKLVDEERLQSKVNLYWIDVALIHERFRTILPWQCINHFPGMPNIARKNRMGQNLNRMQKLFPREYSFYPRTWVLPGELADFRQQFDNNGVALNNKIFIIKPDTGCQGRGIFLTRTLDTVPVSENVVAQIYIKKPLLLDGFKFDLRIYVIVTSVKPLRVYLFHDGLVRMCTEEYVKPTKQNLGMMCMHLTNYAVNKHNENFQQSSASTSEECQDEGSKRSLLWFMNWIRKERGDAKADWVWKRIGVLCTRTLLCIMPTLSREYDQHFKSFTGIPVDMSKIQSPNREAAFAKPPAGGNGTANERGRAGRNLSGSKESSDDDENDENHGVANANEDDGEQEENNAGSNSPAPPVDDEMPKIRGSRCFEILGFDIMMDHDLNPWLIEVNHLPSFGTDSSLDRDIKDRLMRQMFSVVATRGDDYAAYVAFQKVESEKRLILQTKERQAKLEAARQAQQKPLAKSVPRPRPALAHTNSGSNVSNSASSYASKTNNGEVSEIEERRQEVDSNNAELLDEDESICSPERAEEIKKVLLDVYGKHSSEKVSKIDRLLVKYSGHEEEFLLFVFAKYGVSPLSYESEVRRQQRLERIRRLREGREKAATQSVGEMSQSSRNPVIEEDADGVTESQEGEEEGADSDTPTGESISRDDSQDTSALPKAADQASLGHNNNKAREPGKRYSRSLSPPRSGSSVSNSSGVPPRRPIPAWKQSGADDDAQFREDVLSTHVPTEDEEWLRFEMSRLTQCTRIFPLEPKVISADSAHNAAAEAEDGKEMQEETEDVEEGAHANNEASSTVGGGTNNSVTAPPTSSSSSSSIKSATYEEILFQVFLQDRRQTMRLRCPLPNRAIDPNNKDSFLPPLDGSSSSRTSFSSMGTGKGVVGWKAPVKANADATKTTTKQPTQQQLEFAKRLSQGLSVSSKTNATNTNQRFRGPQNVVTVSTDPNVQYSVVLDPQEYIASSTSQGSLVYPNGGIPGQQMPQQQSIYSNGQEIIWPSTKAHRLYEESRNNRIRIEAARANNGAILRQQIFYFDPNYDSYQPALVMGMPPINTSDAGPSVQVQFQQQQQYQGSAERRHSIGDMSTSSMTQGSINSSGAVMLAARAPAQQMQSQAWKGVGVGARPEVVASSVAAAAQLQQQRSIIMNGGGSVMSANGQNIINGKPSVSAGNSLKSTTTAVNNSGLQSQSTKLQYPAGKNFTGTSMMNNPNIMATGGIGMAGHTKQEELLRQLFPSWF